MSHTPAGELDPARRWQPAARGHPWRRPRHAAELRGVLPAALAYAPELWGRLGIRFHLTEKGALDEAFEAETRFPDERVTLCVLRAARA